MAVQPAPGPTAQLPPDEERSAFAKTAERIPYWLVATIALGISSSRS